MKHIRIVEMSHHFLYLPLYHALRTDECYGYLPSGYEIDIPRQPMGGRTDEMAMKALLERNECDLVVCDPTQIFNTKIKSKHRPAVLASLVVNTAFWAVNHNTNTIELFTDLGVYDGIIAYRKGTTSYLIAEKIFNLKSREGIEAKDFIQEVDKDNVLTTLQESKPTVGAISPEILDITNLIKLEPSKYSLDLAIGKTPDFSDILTTAIISTREFVDKNRAFVAGFLRAIDRAIRETNRGEQLVMNRALTLFEDKGYPEHIEEAYTLAVDARVFPDSIEVSNAQWMKAAQLFFESSEGKWEEEQQRKAARAFDEYIATYAHIAKDAPAPISGEKSYIGYMLSGFLLVLVVALFVLDKIDHVALITLLGACGVCALTVRFYYGNAGNKRRKLIYTSVVLVGSLVLLSIMPYCVGYVLDWFGGTSNDLIGTLANIIGILVPVGTGLYAGLTWARRMIVDSKQR